MLFFIFPDENFTQLIVNPCLNNCIIFAYFFAVMNFHEKTSEKVRLFGNKKNIANFYSILIRFFDFRENIVILLKINFCELSILRNFAANKKTFQFLTLIFTSSFSFISQEDDYDLVLLLCSA